MPDFVISLWVENVPNASEGAWRDIDIVRDLKADEADLAAATALARSRETGRVRVTRWDTTVEFDAAPGAPVLNKRTKTA